MLAGGPHEAAGNGSPRWMTVGPRKRAHRTRPTGRLVRRPTSANALSPPALRHAVPPGERCGKCPMQRRLIGADGSRRFAHGAGGRVLQPGFSMIDGGANGVIALRARSFVSGVVRPRPALGGWPRRMRGEILRPGGPRRTPVQRIRQVSCVVVREAECRLNSSARDLIAARDALGVDVQEHLDAVPGPGRDLRGVHASVQPCRHGGVPQVVGAARERRRRLFPCEGGLARGAPDVAVKLVTQEPATVGAEQSPVWGSAEVGEVSVKQVGQGRRYRDDAYVSLGAVLELAPVPRFASVRPPRSR